MEASFFSKPLSQSECRIKIMSQLLSESECRNLGHDLTQKTQTNKMPEARHNADKHYLLYLSFCSREGYDVTSCLWSHGPPGGGVVPPKDDTLFRRQTPPEGRHPLQRGRTPPRRNMGPDRKLNHTPPEEYGIRQEVTSYSPVLAAIEAGSTHSTEMHSCS